MAIRLSYAGQHDFDAVDAFYQSCRYGGDRVNRSDMVLIARQQDEIAGVVRISHEHGFACLRGMQIHPDCRRRGLGSKMLEYLQPKLDMEDCYCLPYAHLVGFYAQVGFAHVAPECLPADLATRLRNYIERGLDVVGMGRNCDWGGAWPENGYSGSLIESGIDGIRHPVRDGESLL